MSLDRSFVVLLDSINHKQGSTNPLTLIIIPHTYSIDLASVGSDPQATSTSPHRGNRGPQVGVGVVAFSCGETAIPIESSTNVHLQERCWRV